MLASQRGLFDIPRDVAYFNAAGWSPIPKAVAEAGRAGALRKAQPWTLTPEFFNGQYERARSAAARIINAEPSDVALISSVGYGVATAAKSLAIARGTRVLVIEDDHSSPVLEWMSRAEAQGFTVDTVPRPEDGDWTAAVLEAIERPGVAPVAVASISSVHWSDGGAIDLDRVAPVLKTHGAALLVDATHAAGIMDLDVRRIDPDFMVFPTYKWLLGPYGRAFLYVARRHQDGVPLEQTSYGRRSVKAEQVVYFEDTRYLPDARRFDMGERDHFISLEMAAVGIETVEQLGRSAVESRLADVTRRIGEGVAELNGKVSIPVPGLRAPHVLSLGFPNGMPDKLVERLADQKIYAAPRLGRLRISPHVYNDEEDVARLVHALGHALA
ncbi:MAG: aminotransferase class V-fold PLP-dependent enzyme [Hyphomicrobiaceae bacterium]|nr:aminotransferase class V-fold PLP-dependent enzyme [Hyphomicrobiaceae bacterium]